MSQPLAERRFSSLDILSNYLKLDIRAYQRTYEGAYTRTAIGCLSFSILIIKMFSKEFLPVGTVYTMYGTLLYFLGVYQTNRVDRFYVPSKQMEMFKTAGDTVLMLTVFSLCSYIAVLALILRI
ncbi:uncharacterized protein SPAPADRAFT_145281 [Spathaspora passalidarum NRRL Y-27907]|uniref:DUF202 domain-containing protein n=1 Tax=Spathaspora passalidarum (strain NRRL Y-27907 / 11-Y1) TaxID=619300 RepID=G3AEZ3_SPAPN|nr:uncharacterized protein SPAPADRAFT_145281 [Spathaspora passalidarum NRRL Y-27907]EGW34796.1 hypothetical protein SPAPADRAFT_145281 [Spathaspora passalidarum NRRL Y-27907]